MKSKFSGMTVELDNTRAKLVFPAKQASDGIKFRKNFSPSQHIHYDIEVHFILAGSYRLISQQQDVILPEDSVCLIPKGYSHQIIQEEPDSDIFNLLASLHPRGNSPKMKTVTQLWNGVREVQVFTDSHRICQHVRDFCTACSKSGEIHEHIKKSLMTLVVCLVTEKLSQRFPNRSKMAQVCSLPDTGEWFDADLENFLMRNYKKKLSREAVAKHIGISTAQLGRIIRRNYGTNYSQLMTSLRMADAKKLLKTEKTITEIAKSLGYTTYNGFAAAFKKYYGITPEEMRKEETK